MNTDPKQPGSLPQGAWKLLKTLLPAGRVVTDTSELNVLAILKGRGFCHNENRFYKLTTAGCAALDSHR